MSSSSVKTPVRGCLSRTGTTGHSLWITLFRRFSTRPPNDVLQQLSRVADLQRRVSAENSKQRKGDIIAQYPDLRKLLEQVYDPDFRTNLSFVSFQKYLLSPTGTPGKTDAPQSIIALLDKLSTREVTGNAAKEMVISFLRAHGVLPEGEGVNNSSPELETFGKLLDRNLVAGFGSNTLSSVNWSETDPSSGYTKSKSLPTDYPKTSSPLTRSLPRESQGRFEVALGKSVSPPFSAIANSNNKWYASRKLDGVRVVTFLDFRLDQSNDTIRLVDVSFRSRSGKVFTSLDKVKQHLGRLERFPGLREWLDRDPASLSQDETGEIRRLVLDGEVCVMRERSGPTAAKRPDDGVGVGSLWSDPTLEEDFTSTVSEIRRHAPYTISHPVYFIFDILKHTDFANGSGSSRFGERVQDIRALGDWLVKDLEAEAEKVIRPLAQWEVNDMTEIDQMVSRAADEGWEGVILRADRPYKGSRSSDIRKFKQWLDAEYKVIGVDNNRMRLAVDGVFGEHDAMANIWIEHKGVKVSVGSGFTAEQRIRFGKHPEDIIGKEVTVEYFSESASSSREEGLSLRFPRVKQIWEEGKRTL